MLLLAPRTTAGVLRRADVNVALTPYSSNMTKTTGRLERLDVVIALSTGALVVAHAAFEPADRPAEVLDFLLLAMASVSLLVVRRLSLIVLAVTVICVFVYLLRVGQDVISVMPVLISIYYSVRNGYRWAPVGATLPFIVNGFVNGSSPSDAILPIGWFAAALCFGEMHEQWHAYLVEARLRAAEAERTKEEAALRRAGEERLRIARDLHDSLTHTMSVIKVQADVAAHLARKRGEQLPESLTAIQEAARDATRELRRSLDALRSEPDIGLALLPDLLERVRSAGVDARLTIGGDRRDLPPDVDRATYRIIQESLTNVARHSGGAAASVDLMFDDDAVTVEVNDDGRATVTSPQREGIGLIGMRERVAAVGGDLDAGPKGGGGFRVRAHLPTNGEPT